MKPQAAVRLNPWTLLPACACLILIIALTAQLNAAELRPDAVNSAEPSGKSLPADKPTPIGIRLQVLLDRAHFSPGEIDGKFGENAKKALRAYAETQQSPGSDTLTGAIWKTLATDAQPVLTNYTISEKDVSGPFLQKLPNKMEDMKGIPRLSYTSPKEALAEKFHMSEHRRIEPWSAFRPRWCDDRRRRYWRGTPGNSGKGRQSRSRQEPTDRQAVRSFQFADRLLSRDSGKQREAIADRLLQGHRDRSQSE